MKRFTAQWKMIRWQRVFFMLDVDVSGTRLYQKARRRKSDAFVLENRMNLLASQRFTKSPQVGWTQYLPLLYLLIFTYLR